MAQSWSTREMLLLTFTIRTYLSHVFSLVHREAPRLPPVPLPGVPARLALDLVQDVAGDLPEYLALYQPLTFHVVLIQTCGDNTNTCSQCIQLQENNW